MVFKKKKGMMVKSNVKNEVSTMGMKKNIFETKREEDDDVDDFEEDEEDRSDMKDQSMSNSKNAKSKLTVGGKKDLVVSFQLPNKGGSATKTTKSLQNTPQSGKKNQNVTSPKQNTLMPGKKNQLLAIPNKNSPMFSKKQALAAQNQSLISSGKKNQGSPVPTNLEQFGGVKPKGKSNTNVSMDNNDDEEDDEDDDEEEDEDDDDEDVTEDMPTPGQKIQPQYIPSKKSVLANKQQQQVAKNPQNNFVQGKKNQAVGGNQNSNAALQGKKAVKKPGALLVQQDDDKDDEDDDDDDEVDKEVDEEEGKKVIQKKNVSLKQDMQSKQPESKKKNKNGLTSVTQETPKDSAGFLSGELLKKQVERKIEQDSRRLFISGFPAGITAEEIKALSSDILNVTFKSPYMCYLDFESGKKADKNHKHLQGKKIKDHNIFVSFTGTKCRIAQNKVLGPRKVLKNRLLCDGIPAGTNISDIAQLFPTASNLILDNSAYHWTACVTFRSFKDAAEAFEANENSEIQGKSIVVLYAPIPINERRQIKRKNPPRPYGGPTRPYVGPTRPYGGATRPYEGRSRPYGGPAAKKRRF